MSCYALDHLAQNQGRLEALKKELCIFIAQAAGPQSLLHVGIESWPPDDLFERRKLLSVYLVREMRGKIRKRG